MKASSILLFFSLLLMAGCGNIALAEEKNHAQSAKILAFTKHSGITERKERIITSEKEYEGFIVGIFKSFPEEMKVDFSKNHVLTATLGERPNSCYGLEVGRVGMLGAKEESTESEPSEGTRTAGKTMLVEIIEKVPGENCMCAQVVVTPSIVLLLPKIEMKDIKIVHRKSVLKCN